MDKEKVLSRQHQLPDSPSFSSAGMATASSLSSSSNNKTATDNDVEEKKISEVQALAEIWGIPLESVPASSGLSCSVFPLSHPNKSSIQAHHLKEIQDMAAGNARCAASLTFCVKEEAIQIAKQEAEEKKKRTIKYLADILGINYNFIPKEVMEDQDVFAHWFSNHIAQSIASSSSSSLDFTTSQQTQSAQMSSGQKAITNRKSILKVPTMPPKPTSSSFQKQQQQQPNRRPSLNETDESLLIDLFCPLTAGRRWSETTPLRRAFIETHEKSNIYVELFRMNKITQKLELNVEAVQLLQGANQQYKSKVDSEEEEIDSKKNDEIWKEEINKIQFPVSVAELQSHFSTTTEKTDECLVKGFLNPVHILSVLFPNQPVLLSLRPNLTTATKTNVVWVEHVLKESTSNQVAVWELMDLVYKLKLNINDKYHIDRFDSKKLPWDTDLVYEARQFYEQKYSQKLC